METKLSLKDCLAYGWQTLRARPLPFIAAVVLVDALSYTIVYLTPEQPLLAALGPIPALVVFVLATAATSAIAIIVDTNFMLRAHDIPSTVSYQDIVRPRRFLALVGAELLAFLLIMIGFVLFIIPGLILSAVFFFANFLAVDKGLSPVAALKRSRELTKGNRWPLFWLIVLSLASAAVYVSGSLVGELFGNVLEFFVDLVIIPVTGLASAHAYRTLQQAHTTALVVEPSVGE